MVSKGDSRAGDKVYENMRAYSLDTKNEFKPNQFYNKDLNGDFHG